MPSYEDYLPTLRFQPAFAVSPDDRYVAYIDDSQNTFNIAMKPLTGGASRTLTSLADKAVRQVAWHPSGRSVVLSADTGGDEQTRIYLLDIDDSTLAELTDGASAQYEIGSGSPVSPDGQLLAYTGNDRNPNDQDVLVRELATSSVRRVCRAAEGKMYAGFWSRDGTFLTASDRIDQESHHVLYLIDPDGGTPRRLTSREVQATYWLGPWLPDSSGFVVRSNLGREFTGLAILNADSGEVTWLDTPAWDVDAVAMSGDGRLLVWSVNVDGLSRLRARDLTTGSDIAMPTLPAGVVFDLAVTTDGSSAIMRLSTATLPVNLVVADIARTKLRWLTDAEPVAADPATFVEPTLVKFPARDGREVPAYLYRPTKLTDPVGVLLSIHGGPDHQERPVYMYDGLYQYLLSQGVAILVPNFRGSRGYGVSSVRLIHRDWGGGDLDDLAGAAEYLGRQGWADPARIGLLGASYGGFAVLSCLSRLSEVGWAAAVDLFGPSNLVTLARLAPPTWRARVRTMIGDPEADREFLLSRSPITYADKIRAPLFVIQGANDPRVPQTESDQIVDHLRRRGIDVRYDVYPDEGHGFLRRENRVKAFSDTAEFLLAHLRHA